MCVGGGGWGGGGVGVINFIFLFHTSVSLRYFLVTFSSRVP